MKCTTNYNNNNKLYNKNNVVVVYNWHSIRGNTLDESARHMQLPQALEAAVQ